LAAQADIYCLGVLTFELLTGMSPAHPLPSVQEARPELPAALDEVLSRATAERPEDRFERVEDFLRALRQVLGADVVPVAPAEKVEPVGALRNPYKGLRSFQEVDAQDFFGRDALIDRLVEAVGAHRLVAVVGPSGSGKSSVVRAGLIPALRAGALSSFRDWLVTDMFPGAYPFEELEAALLRVAVERPGGLLDELRNDERGLLRVAKQILPHDDSELLLMIDQFEELFSLTGDEKARRLFLDSLETVAGDPRGRVRVVVTLRADFFDRPLQYQRFGELLQAGLVPVTVPSEENLALAIGRPARRVGLEPEAGLIGEIVREVANQPGALPLMQYALTELFHRRDGSLLTLQAYRDSAGVLGALGRRAEEIYQGFSEQGKEAAQQLFLRLVTVSEEADDTRRRVRQTEMRGLAIDQNSLDEVVHQFGAHRLLSFDRDPVTRTPTVEVAHEALLREWKRLREWVDERREDLILHARFEGAVREWEESAREPSYLPSGGRLQQFESWAAGTQLALTEGERVYLAESREHANRQELRERRRRRGVLASLSLAAVVALVLAGVAWVQRERVEGQRRRAFAVALANASIANLAVDQERAVLLAIEAVETTRRADGTVLREAEEALHRSVRGLRLVGTLPGGTDLAVSGAGQVAIAGRDGVALYDLESAEQVASLPTEAAGLEALSVDVSSDGNRLAIGRSDGIVVTWDLLTGSVEALQDPEALRQERGVPDVRFSPDGASLAMVDERGYFSLWDLAQRSGVAGEKRVALPGVDLDGRVAFSPDGKYLAVAAEFALIWDVHVIVRGSRTEVEYFPGQLSDATFLGNSSLVTVGRDGLARIWQVIAPGPSLQELDSFPLEEAAPTAVSAAPSGQLLAAGFETGLVRVWRLSDAGLAELFPLWGHRAAVRSLAFSPDGRLLISVSEDATRIWDVTPLAKREWAAVQATRQVGADLAFSPDGQLLAVAQEEGAIDLFDPSTGEQRGRIQPTTPWLGFAGWIAISPDGERLAASFMDLFPEPSGLIRVFDLATGEERLILDDVGQGSLSLSPDGRRLAVAWSGGVNVYDLATDDKVALQGTGEPGVRHVVFSPDGGSLAFQDSAGLIDIYEVPTWRHVVSFGHSIERPALGLGSIRFSPDGAQLLTAGQDGTAKVWDTATGRSVLTLRGHTGALARALFSPDGRRIATAGVDGTIRLWDPVTGAEELLLEEFRPNISGIAFSPDGLRLAAISADGTAGVYALALEDLLDIARSRVTRSLTDDECRAYLQLEVCPADATKDRT
ncbi:MAG: hypothetical protein ACRDVL_09165, partial [Acidimicrobiia bacterium]